VGDTERSYDSRYWGLVDASWVVGRAYPVFSLFLIMGTSLGESPERGFREFSPEDIREMEEIV